MILLPAVDIRDGKAVRLERGEFDAETVYDADPLQAAERWAKDGARALHLVDLDGARTGTPSNLEHVERIAKRLDVPIQVGGGLRSVGAVERTLAAGAARVVIGTAAYRDQQFLEELIERHAERVIVSVDARGGRVAAAGWLEQTGLGDTELIERLCDGGVQRFVYSSIERDGMLQGPDLERAEHVAERAPGRVLYSGGIASLEDLRALGRLDLAGVIVGKALYERRFTVAEAQAAL